MIATCTSITVFRRAYRNVFRLSRIIPYTSIRVFRFARIAIAVSCFRESMNTAQLLRSVECDNVLQAHCIGVFPSDRLPLIDRDPACVIANTDPHTMPGKHWVGFYIDGWQCEFFDSYGNPPTNKNFLRFMNQYNVQYNTEQVQAPLTSACGQHVLHYLFHRCRGDSTILECYTKDLFNNDQSVCDFVNDLCDISVAPVDHEFIYKQVARMLEGR